jgi:hypothetical protein
MTFLCSADGCNDRAAFECPEDAERKWCLQHADGVKRTCDCHGRNLEMIVPLEFDLPPFPGT